MTPLHVLDRNLVAAFQVLQLLLKQANLVIVALTSLLEAQLLPVVLLHHFLVLRALVLEVFESLPRLMLDLQVLLLAEMDQNDRYLQ